MHMLRASQCLGAGTYALARRYLSCYHGAPRCIPQNTGTAGQRRLPSLGLDHVVEANQTVIVMELKANKEMVFSGGCDS